MVIRTGHSSPLNRVESSCGWGTRIRTWEWRYQKPLSYHLTMPQQVQTVYEWAFCLVKFFTQELSDFKLFTYQLKYLVNVSAFLQLQPTNQFDRPWVFSRKFAKPSNAHHCKPLRAKWLAIIRNLLFRVNQGVIPNAAEFVFRPIPNLKKSFAQAQKACTAHSSRRNSIR